MRVKNLDVRGQSPPYEPHFDPDDPTGEDVIFPVYFLYPQYETSDLVSHFAERTPFSAHLALMFPPQAPAPEWDARKQYTAHDLVVYAPTHRRRLLKVGKKMSLRDVCKAAEQSEGGIKDGLEMKGGFLSFVVLPKGDVEKNWVDEFKRKRETESQS